MSDKEIIQGILDRDNRITYRFFFVKARPLLTAVMHAVFSYPVEYDEMVNELYRYLMASDGARLRQFQFRSSIYQWLKVVATRFFIRRRNTMIDDTSQQPSYIIELGDDRNIVDSPMILTRKIDVALMLDMMSNRRYADVIRNLILEDIEPDKYAARIGVTVDNLYNIKRRAMSAFARIATKYYGYE